MIQDQQAKIQQAIALLNEVAGKGSVPQQPHQNVQANAPPSGFPLFEQQFKAFEAKGKEIGGQVAQLVNM